MGNSSSSSKKSKKSKKKGKSKKSKKSSSSGGSSSKSKKGEVIKILILGAGECGKSTILKQIKIIHGVPFGSADKEAIRESLRQNTMTAIHTLLDAVVKLKIKVDSKSAAIVRQLADHPAMSPLDEEASQLVVDFWARKPAKKAWKRRAEFWHLDNAEYYFEHAPRFAAEDFDLRDDDIVLARVRTTGVLYTTFEVDGATYSIADVGGQRSERKKWARAIENVRAVMFVVNLAGYHQRLFEDEAELKLPESIELFDRVVQNEAFSSSAMMLVFNKRDIYERLLKSAPLSECFSDFSDVEEDYEDPLDPELVDKGIAFIVQKFKSVYQTNSAAPSSKRAINHFVLSARDRKQCEKLVDTVVEFIQDIL